MSSYSSYRGLNPTIVSRKQQEINEAFGGQLYIDNQLDVTTGRLWDSVRLQKGSEVNDRSLELFTNIGPSFNKLYAHTNLYQPRSLPPPESFSVLRIIFTFGKQTSDMDMWKIAENCVWGLWLGSKRYPSSLMVAMQTVVDSGSPLKTCDYCLSWFCNTNRCPNCGASQFQLTGFTDSESGSFRRQFFIELLQPIVILNQMAFYVGFEYFEPFVCDSDISLWCHLEGWHARAVQ